MDRCSWGARQALRAVRRATLRSYCLNLSNSVMNFSSWSIFPRLLFLYRRPASSRGGKAVGVGTSTISILGGISGAPRVPTCSVRILSRYFCGLAAFSGEDKHCVRVADRSPFNRDILKVLNGQLAAGIKPFPAAGIALRPAVVHLAVYAGGGSSRFRGQTWRACSGNSLGWLENCTC